MLRNIARLPANLCKFYSVANHLVQHHHRPIQLLLNDYNRRFSLNKSAPVDSQQNTPTIRSNATTDEQQQQQQTSVSADDLDRKLKILKLEVSVLRQEGRKVPDPELMKPAHWDHLLQLSSRSARSKYYSFLWSIERKKESSQVPKPKNHFSF